MNQRVNKFMVWNIIKGDFEDYHKTIIDNNGVLYLDENIKKANQDVFHVLPYIQKNDIHNQEIYQGHILHDTSGYFNTDIIVCYDKFSDGWTDQFETEPLQDTLLKGKFEIIGHVLTLDKFQGKAVYSDNTKLAYLNPNEEVIIPNSKMNILYEVEKLLKIKVTENGLIIVKDGE